MKGKFGKHMVALLLAFIMIFSMPTMTLVVSADGEETIKENPVEPTITLEDTEKTHDGKPVVPQVKVIGVNGEATGQKVIYEYYSDATCETKLSGAPTNAGTYYVKVSVKANENYTYKKQIGLQRL